jgi:hypothetical protein
MALSPAFSIAKDERRFAASVSPQTRSAAYGGIATSREILKGAPSTSHRWLADGTIAGEQITPGAPWNIRITDELRARFVEEAPKGYVAMLEATLLLGVTRQTVLQRVKRGELEAVHVVRGRRKGIRIKIVDDQPDLFTHSA